MLTTGDAAPDFRLPDETGREVALHDLLARGPVVLFFYPADSTRVCTAQVCMFRDAYAQLAAAGLQVVGISPQGVESKATFKAAHRVPYPLLADPRREAVRAYGVGGLMGLPLPIGTRRATFLIGRDGKILDRVVAELDIERHRAFATRAIGAAGTPSTRGDQASGE